jgi:hypothetical protein
MKYQLLIASVCSLWTTQACTKKVSTPCDSCGGDCVTDFIPQKKQAIHRPGPIDYAENPPASGDHNECWSTWGIHAEAVDTENWVHNLEHGGLVFLYDCPEGCADEITELEAFVNSLPEGRALLTPAFGLPSPFAAISWENRLLTGCLDIPAMQAFFDEHVNHSPEDLTLDPPAKCSE